MPGPEDSTHGIFVRYIERSRDYYEAEGYANPYRWARNTGSPFAPLSRPLAECRVGIVTTAGLLDGEAEPDPFSTPRVVFSAPTDPPPGSLYTMHRAWDKEATHTRNLASFFPLRLLPGEPAADRSAGRSDFGAGCLSLPPRTGAEDEDRWITFVLDFGYGYGEGGRLSGLPPSLSTVRG